MKFLQYTSPFYSVRHPEHLNNIFYTYYENNEFCLITEQAYKNVNEVHNRQPVILNEKDVNRYLNLELSGSDFLKECKKTNLAFYEISKEVNKPTNNSISLIQQKLN